MVELLPEGGQWEEWIDGGVVMWVCTVDPSTGELGQQQQMQMPAAATVGQLREKLELRLGLARGCCWLMLRNDVECTVLSDEQVLEVSNRSCCIICWAIFLGFLFLLCS